MHCRIFYRLPTKLFQLFINGRLRTVSTSISTPNHQIKHCQTCLVLFIAYFGDYLPFRQNSIQMKSSSFSRTGVLFTANTGVGPFSPTDCEMTSRYNPSVVARAIDSHNRLPSSGTFVHTNRGRRNKIL